MSGLFSKPCQFIAGAATLESLPPVSHAEIAFAGRSNVGKSSLVNALVGQKTLAKTSQNPGHTKQLNFFLLADALMLVDMPGYGYAKVSKQQKGQWDRLIKNYLLGRPSLKRVCVLIDARRGAMKHDDEFMTMLDDSAVGFQLVLTKMDALSASEQQAAREAAQKVIARHVAAHPQLVATSSLSKDGIEELQEQLAPFAKPL